VFLYGYTRCQFLIDTHPQSPAVLVASPCSGHGFKFASVIGELLADLAMTGARRPTCHSSSSRAIARLPGPVRDDPDALECNEASSDHLIELGEDGIDVLLCLDAFDHNRQIE